MVWNLRGAVSVGGGSVGMFCVLLSPFVVLTAVGLWKGLVGGQGLGAAGIVGLKGPGVGEDFAGALSVTLWNYMGWDNASTVAQEVEQPQRNYPKAMLWAAGLVALTYVLPLAAVGLAGIPAERFSTGAWADAARELVGPWLALCVVLGGTDQWIGDVQRADDELHTGFRMRWRRRGCCRRWWRGRMRGECRG